MDVITQAVNELRHTAALIHASHTIEGKWADEEGKAEHDRLLSLADALSRQPQERGEAVGEIVAGAAGTMRHPVWVGGVYPPVGTKLYAHPPADDARVAFIGGTEAMLRDRIAALEAQLAASREREGRMRELLADLIGAVKHLNPCPATMEKATAALSAGEKNDGNA